MVNFSKASAFQSGVCSILSNLMTKAEDLEELRQMFLTLDTDGDGTINFEELKANMEQLKDSLQLDEQQILEIMLK